MRRVVQMLAALAVLAGCKAPIPDRERLEEDAAWSASEWRDDQGDVWRVRINSRRISATEVQPDSGRALRGAIASGALTFSMLDRGGQEIGKGQATIADAHHALFYMQDMAGKEIAHGLWHFDHAPNASVGASAVVATPAPAIAPSTPAPSVAPSSSPEPSPSMVETPTPPGETPSPEASSTSAPPTPGKPGDPLDLRPH